jgi:hypothetical protein
MAKIMTGFSIGQHGFHFGNEFKNEIIKNCLGSWTTKGRCGGMAFAALDYFYAKMAVPAHTADCFPGGKVPDDTSSLARYIWDRLMDSFMANGMKFAEWSLKRDHSTLVWGEGVPQLTKNEEFPKLMNALKNGPVALGIINTQNVLAIGDNHQVVAYGAELDEATGKMTVYIYDNNNPDTDVQLTSDPTDLYFSTNLVYSTGDHAGEHARYRGFFVEDYCPKIPVYTDLVVTSSLIASSYYLGLGGSLGASFAMKNRGDYPSPIMSMFVGVSGPTGENLDYFFGGDANSASLQPGEERVYNKRCEEFGKTSGTFTLKAGYVSMSHLAVFNLPGMAVSSTGQFYSPARETIVKVEGLAGRIAYAPPFVASVDVIAVDASNSALTRKKYHGEWLVQTNGRTLQKTSEPVTPGLRTLFFNIEFSTPGEMKSSTVKLNLTGRSPIDNSNINIPVALTGKGSYFSGSWKPDNRFKKNYSLTLEIQGTDDFPRYSLRNPSGNVIDCNPATAASVDQTKPNYPFLNYEPGTDRNHVIQITAPVVSLNPDALEKNDDFVTATKVILDNPGKQALFATNVKSWKSYENLTLHNNVDQDFFNVTFQSVPEDDKYSLVAPVSQVLCSFLGLSVTTYPPLVWVSLQNQDDGLTDMVIFKSDLYKRAVAQTLNKGNYIRLNDPALTFPDKKFYVQIKNSDYATQGALKYSIEFGYMPVSTQLGVDFNAAAYRPQADIRYRLIKRLIDALNLPRPSDDILSQVSGQDLVYQPGGMIISDMKVVLQNTEKFLKNADTVKDMKAVALKNYASVMATEYQNLGKAAQSAGIPELAAQFYTESGSRYGKLGRQADVLKVNESLSVLQNVKVSKILDTKLKGKIIK